MVTNALIAVSRSPGCVLYIGRDVLYTGYGAVDLGASARDWEEGAPSALGGAGGAR
jgi:hypothetical protein